MEKKRTFAVRLMTGYMRLRARLPLKYHYRCARFIAWMVGDVLRYRRDVVMTNLARSFPDWKYGELEAVRDRFYLHFGEILSEAVWFGGCRGESGRKRLREQHLAEIENIREFNDFYNRSTSVMLLNSHAGNWEIMGGVGQYDSAAEGERTWEQENVVVLYKRLSNGFWDRVMAENRCAPVSDLGYEGYVESDNILRYAVSHRREKRLYIFNTDQYPYGKARYCEVPSFLRQPARAMVGGAALACKLGMSVAYIRWFQEEPGRYRLTFVPLFENAADHTPEEIMRTYYSCLEKDIEAQPWNYLWTHKGWK